VFLAVMRCFLPFLQIIIMQTPVGTIFKVTEQTWQEWLFAVAVGAGSMIGCVLGKILAR
jgi:hypothetical protein